METKKEMIKKIKEIHNKLKIRYDKRIENYSKEHIGIIYNSALKLEQKMETKLNIGDKVVVKNDTLSTKQNGKIGIVTYIGTAILSVGVTLDGDKFETDFLPQELEVKE